MPGHGTNVPRGLDRAAPSRGRFGRMFGSLPAATLDLDLIKDLVDAMRSAPAIGDNPRIPAGFTYLGQFIDHDITFDPTSQLGAASTTRMRSSTSARRGSTSTRSTAQARRPAVPVRAATRPVRLMLLDDGDATRPAAQRSGPRADRRPAQRRERHRLAAAPAVHPLPQPGRRPCPRRPRPRRGGVARGGAADRPLALPVDRRTRFPAPRRRPSDELDGSPHRILPLAGRPVHPRRVLGRGVPVRPQHGSRQLPAQ